MTVKMHPHWIIDEFFILYMDSLKFNLFPINFKLHPHSKIYYYTWIRYMWDLSKYLLGFVEDLGQLTKFVEMCFLFRPTLTTLAKQEIKLKAVMKLLTMFPLLVIFKICIIMMPYTTSDNFKYFSNNKNKQCFYVSLKTIGQG